MASHYSLILDTRPASWSSFHLLSFWLLFPSSFLRFCWWPFNSRSSAFLRNLPLLNISWNPCGLVSFGGLSFSGLPRFFGCFMCCSIIILLTAKLIIYIVYIVILNALYYFNVLVVIINYHLCYDIHVDMIKKDSWYVLWYVLLKEAVV